MSLSPISIVKDRMLPIFMSGALALSLGGFAVLSYPAEPAQAEDLDAVCAQITDATDIEEPLLVVDKWSPFADAVVPQGYAGDPITIVEGGSKVDPMMAASTLDFTENASMKSDRAAKFIDRLDTTKAPYARTIYNNIVKYANYKQDYDANGNIINGDNILLEDSVYKMSDDPAVWETSQKRLTPSVKAGTFVQYEGANAIVVAKIDVGDNSDWNMGDPRLQAVGDWCRAAWTAYTYDHPEGFFFNLQMPEFQVAPLYDEDGTGQYLAVMLCPAWSYGYGIQIQTMSICDTVYWGSQSKIIETYNNCMNTISAWTTEVSDKTPYEQIVYFNKQLCDNNNYNNFASPANIAPFRAPSALIDMGAEGDPVCEGFSRAMQWLCQNAKSGSDGEVISRPIGCTLQSGKTNVPHMWNLVQLDGKWYNLDTTFNATTPNNNTLYTAIGSANPVLQSHTISNKVEYFDDMGELVMSYDFANYPEISEEDYVPSDKRNTEVKVSLEYDKVTATGAPLTPVVSVSHLDGTPVDPSWYTVEYYSNTEPGAAGVYVSSTASAPIYFAGHAPFEILAADDDLEPVDPNDMSIEDSGNLVYGGTTKLSVTGAPDDAKITYHIVKGDMELIGENLRFKAIGSMEVSAEVVIGDNATTLTHSFNVAKRPLDISVSIEPRAYNGSNKVSNVRVSASNLVSGDKNAINISIPSSNPGTFADANVGTDKPCTVNISVTGSKSNLYTYPTSVQSTGTITPLALNLDAINIKGQSVPNGAGASILPTTLTWTGISPSNTTVSWYEDAAGTRPVPASYKFAGEKGSTTTLYFKVSTTDPNFTAPTGTKAVVFTLSDDPAGNTNINTNTNTNTQPPANTNTNANTNSNVNQGGSNTNANTNTQPPANVNTNTNSNTNSNVNTNINTNTNSNVNGNTNTNTQPPANVNTNTNSNANSNTVRPGNENTNANGNINSNTVRPGNNTNETPVPPANENAGGNTNMTPDEPVKPTTPSSTIDEEHLIKIEAGENVANAADIKASGELTVQGDIVLRIEKCDMTDALRTAIGDNNLVECYSIKLLVDGQEVHDNFGKLTIQLPLDSSYIGKRICLWHEHADANITDAVYVVEPGDNNLGKLTFETTDLSIFALTEVAEPAGADNAQATDNVPANVADGQTGSTGNVSGTLTQAGDLIVGTMAILLMSIAATAGIVFYNRRRW